MVVMAWMKGKLTQFSCYIGIVLVWFDPLVVAVFTSFIRIVIITLKVLYGGLGYYNVKVYVKVYCEGVHVISM